MHPQVLRQLADDRHQEMRAQAGQHRLAGRARASRRTERAERRMRRATRMVRRLRSELEQ